MVHLIIFRIDTGRRGVEHFRNFLLLHLLEHMEITEGTVVHNIGIVISGKDKTGSTHIGSQLVNLIQVRCDDLDRRSTRLNSSHVAISYPAFGWKKKKQT